MDLYWMRKLLFAIWKKLGPWRVVGPLKKEKKDANFVSLIGVLAGAHKNFVGRISGERMALEFAFQGEDNPLVDKTDDDGTMLKYVHCLYCPCSLLKAK